MVKLNCNIDEFLSHYKKKIKAIQLSIEQIATKLAEKMSEDMAKEIDDLSGIWEEDEPNTNLDNLEPVDFQIQVTSPTSAKVIIGQKMHKLTMSDGTKVSPVFFIEFGAGILGLENPQQHHSEHGWEYNINDHETWWYFKGTDGHTKKSIGNIGINFMYYTIEKYKESWKDLFIQLVKENATNV